MVQTSDSVGVVTSDVFASPMNGGPRQKVKWDANDNETAWNPLFLRPEKSSEADDPDVVSDGHVRRNRARVEFDAEIGVTVLIPGGFDRVA